MVEVLGNVVGKEMRLGMGDLWIIEIIWFEMFCGKWVCGERIGGKELGVGRSGEVGLFRGGR